MVVLLLFKAGWLTTGPGPKIRTWPTPSAVIAGFMLALTIGSVGASAQPARSENLTGTVACDDWRLFPDADFVRFSDTLESLDLCIAYEPFQAGGIEWRLLRLQRSPTIPPSAPLVVVLHDDEDAALAGALGLLALRDVQVVTLDANEQRLWNGVDPNRMFVAQGAVVSACPHLQHLDHRFAATLLRDWDGQSPVVSLHSNAPGYLGDGENGRGSISMLSLKPHQHAYPASLRAEPSEIDTRLSDPDNLIYITGPTPLPGEQQSALIPDLQARGLNVLYSRINPLSQDCSLSDFLTLAGQSALYFNIEVKEGDTAVALTMTRRLMRAIDQHIPATDRP